MAKKKSLRSTEVHESIACTRSANDPAVRITRHYRRGREVGGTVSISSLTATGGARAYAMEEILRKTVKPADVLWARGGTDRFTWALKTVPKGLAAKLRPACKTRLR